MDENMDEMMTWFGGILSHTLLQIASNNLPHTYDFWVEQGGPILLALTQSAQEDVQERAASGLGYLVELNDCYDATVRARAKEVMRNGGICIILDLAKSCQKMLQFLAAMAIAYLFANVNVSKALVEGGGIEILTSLVRSPKRLVAQVVVNGLWNLSAEKKHQAAIAEAGAVKALVDLINNWPYDHHDVLGCAAGALANLINDDKSCKEVAPADGVHALIMLARNCELKGVQKKYEHGCAACVLSNLAFVHDTDLVIVEERGVPTPVDLCSSVTKMPRFMAAIALAFLFERSVDEDALVALKQLKVYVQQRLAELTERGYVQPTQEFLCSEDLFPDELRAFAAFALLL